LWFYDESGEFTYKVGLPGKSGIGGGIVALFQNLRGSNMVS
jgi:glutaminase